VIGDDLSSLIVFINEVEILLFTAAVTPFRIEPTNRRRRCEAVVDVLEEVAEAWLEEGLVAVPA
jgi:hypothetical protein